MFKPVIIIPCFNHADAFYKVAKHLAEYKIPVILIDDGSNSEQTKKLASICTKYSYIYLRHNKNLGKGAAMITGLKYAEKQGFSNAIQIDADGQHDIKDIKKFIILAKKHQKSLIMGQPIYDSSAPKSRLIGRKITDFWVAVETLNCHMPDVMCGFRVYPIEMTNNILSSIHFLRMGFDIEIVVKLYRAGIKLVTTETRVTYPKSGTSNFHVWRDNFFISLMHIYLCFGLPFWLLSKISKKIKKLFLFFLLFCGTANAQNITKMPPTLKTFTDNLDTVSASYTQTKTLPESTKTFQAKGVVKFVKNIGFKWKQQSPNKFNFISTLDSYCINGNTEELSALPYFSQVQSMIQSMLDGDMGTFLSVFNADYSESKQNSDWKLVAIPKISAVSDFLKSMTFMGNIKDLNKLIITYKNGTKIIINFKRIKVDIPDEIKC